jgi:hypothetical protein
MSMGNEALPVPHHISCIQKGVMNPWTLAADAAILNRHAGDGTKQEPEHDKRQFGSAQEPLIPLMRRKVVPIRRTHNLRLFYN